MLNTHFTEDRNLGQRELAPFQLTTKTLAGYPANQKSRRSPQVTSVSPLAQAAKPVRLSSSSSNGGLLLLFF